MARKSLWPGAAYKDDEIVRFCWRKWPVTYSELSTPWFINHYQKVIYRHIGTFHLMTVTTHESRGFSNHQQLKCFSNFVSNLITKKTSIIDGFTLQRAINRVRVSITRRHHVLKFPWCHAWNVLNDIVCNGVILWSNLISFVATYAF